MPTQQVIPLSVLDERISEIEAERAKIDAIVRALDGEREILLGLRQRAVTLSANGGQVMATGTVSYPPLTTAIVHFVRVTPGLTSGDIADKLEGTEFEKRSDSRDFRKMVQTVVGQLVSNGKLLRGQGGVLSLPPG